MSINKGRKWLFSEIILNIEGNLKFSFFFFVIILFFYKYVGLKPNNYMQNSKSLESCCPLALFSPVVVEILFNYAKWALKKVLRFFFVVVVFLWLFN